MNEKVQKLREIGATAHGHFLREYITEKIAERTSLKNINSDVELQAAKKVSAILEEDILQHLSPVAEQNDEPLVNEFD